MKSGCEVTMSLVRESVDGDFNPFADSAVKDEAQNFSLFDEVRPVATTAEVDDAEVHKPTIETYDGLQGAYDFFNQRLFDGQLPHCLITLQREKRSLGYFVDTKFARRRTGETCDEIAMNPRFFATRSVRETLSTLVHEMVHLWQFHFGKKARKGYHNKEWGDRMERIGLMPSNTGEPGGKKVGEKMSHYIIAGGVFDVACSELLAGEFSLISWMDRDAAPARPAVAPDVAAAAGMQLPSPDESAEVEAAGKYVAPTTERQKAQPRDKSNRTKYRCPSCTTQVWGKPGLALMCGVVHCGGARFVVVNACDTAPAYAPRARSDEQASSLTMRTGGARRASTGGSETSGLPAARVACVPSHLPH